MGDNRADDGTTYRTRRASTNAGASESERVSALIDNGHGQLGEYTAFSHLASKLVTIPRNMDAQPARRHRLRTGSFEELGG